MKAQAYNHNQESQAGQGVELQAANLVLGADLQSDNKLHFQKVGGNAAAHVDELKGHGKLAYAVRVVGLVIAALEWVLYYALAARLVQKNGPAPHDYEEVEKLQRINLGGGF